MTYYLYPAQNYFVLVRLGSLFSVMYFPGLRADYTEDALSNSDI